MSNSRSRTTPARTASGSKGRATASHSIGFERWIVLAFVALLGLAGGLFLISAGGNDDNSDAVGKLEHVHGLGVDPADGTLYAGTHHGLFRLPDEGSPVRVDGHVQDLMGFTVVGAGHFLASGHPGPEQAGPSSLGLLESTDRGRTWEPRSLVGEADFHALQMRHGRVYGYDSMTAGFMVSEDLRAWETRTQLPMADFAVSPDDPDVVLATTEEGLARSVDGGASFAPLRQTPRLLLVAWDDGGTVLGIDPGGQVHVSDGDLTSWQSRGRLQAAPQALEMVGGRDVYVAVQGAVLASGDGGRSFEILHGE